MAAFEPPPTYAEVVLINEKTNKGRFNPIWLKWFVDLAALLPGGSAVLGTVTSVAASFTGGLITVGGSPITTTGTLALTVAGTSGGIPYFSAATTWASSAALTNHGVIVGGGAGAAPTALSVGASNTYLKGITGADPAFTAIVLASADFANQGTTATVLHGNAAGNPSFAAVALATEVSGTLPVANGGTGYTTKPAFLAYNSSIRSNVTGNGTVYTIAFDTEVFDLASNYDNTTYTFTAPVTGKYRFSAHLMCLSTTLATDFSLQLVTSNRTYTLTYYTPGTADRLGDCLTALCDLDSGDTCTVAFALNGIGADTADVYGTTSPFTAFSGELVA